MQKIPTLFQRDPDDRKHVLPIVSEGCEWVLAGEGVATRKYDGSGCLVRDGKFYRRHEIKPGKSAPANFEAATEADPNTGKQQGWVPVGDGPEDRWFREGWDNYSGTPIDGTYELVGPKVQGNREQREVHELVAHATAEQFPDAPRDFESLRTWLLEKSDTVGQEGLVWHHPDGRMAKLKSRDFS